MSQETPEPRICPFCEATDSFEAIGRGDDGTWYMHCEDCDRDYAIKDVTGKVKVKVEVQP